MKWRWGWLFVLLLSVAVLGSSQTLFTEDFEGAMPPGLPGGWVEITPPGRGLWKVVDKAEFGGELEEVRAFPSGNQALYYGNVAQPAGKGTYDTGGATKGCVSTPVILVTAGDWLLVRFALYRIVESYAPGGYDKATVYVVFRNTAAKYLDPNTGEVVPSEALARKVVFHRDSKEPTSTPWATVTSDYVQAPHGAADVYVGFEFDSVDGYKNNFLGWLVDDVRVVKTGGPLRIVTSVLPDWTQGTPYDVDLEEAGGTPPYTWSLARGSALPGRLELDPRTGQIRGTPEHAGLFPLRFVLADSVGAEVEKELVLKILPRTGWPTPKIGLECFDGGPGTWTTTGLWRRTDKVMYHGADLVLPDPTNYVAYYGNASYNYDTGDKGCLTSPSATLGEEDEGKLVWIAFQYWREVESYANGSYDRTSVEVSFNRGDTWTTVWFKDSRDPSERAWVAVNLQTDLAVPKGARWLTIQFCFDSVDSQANKFVGWLVDCVQAGVVAIAKPLAITTTCPLPEGTLGVAYAHTLKAEGGTAPYAWEVTGLPRGLAVDRLTGAITGTPTEHGRFPLTVTVTDAASSRATIECLLFVSEAVVFFSETFSSCPFGAQWEAPTGLWTCTASVSYGGVDVVPAAREPAAYYGQSNLFPPKYNYDTDARTAGTLTSKPFSIAGAGHVRVSFDYWREVEAYSGAYDQTAVQVRFGAGPWKTLWYKDSSHPSEKAWTSYVSPGITVPAGATTMQIRFAFDSGDKHNNDYVGWIVDNIRVTKAASGSPLSALAVPEAEPRGAPKLSVFNYPNPVRDVHTTTFVVRGVEAEALRVEVYDLSGRLVYKAEVPGSELVWHTDDLYGRYLANGVYLYRAYVKVGGTWIASEIQKLAIFR